MEKRAQGRPSRVAGVVGRQKIIGDIRNVLRGAGEIDTSRKGLAEAIGITPALITYYFPNPESLFEEVAVPVIEQHRILLSGIVRREERPEEKIRDIIGALNDLYGRDARLLDMYKSIESKHPDDYAEISTMTMILAEFFACEEDGKANLNAVVLQGAVRGMCEWAKRALVASQETEKSASSPGWLAAMCSLATSLRFSTTASVPNLA